MSETSTIFPIWKYLADDYSEKDVATSYLLIWVGGACVAGYKQDGTPIIIQTYLTRQQPDATWLQRLVKQDIILKNNTKKVKKIWLSAERNILIPNNIYVNNRAESWIRKFHHLEPDEILLHFELNPAVNAHIVFPVSEVLKTVLNDTFSNAEIAPIANMAFQPAPKESLASLQMVCLPKEILITLSQNGKFIYHLVYPYEHPKNIIYKLALILDEKGIRQEDIDSASFCGLAPFWNNILLEIPPFFPLKVVSENTTEISLDFFKKLYTCE